MTSIEAIFTIIGSCLLLGLFIGWTLHVIVSEWARRRLPVDFDDVFLQFKEQPMPEPKRAGWTWDEDWEFLQR